MEKYKITKVSMDNYKLEYKDKTIEFNSKVDYINRIQEANKTARLKMIVDLQKQGLSIKDLVQEKKVDGKTLYDNSSKEYIEEQYINEEKQNIFLDVVNKMMGVDFGDLIIDIGLNGEEAGKLGEEIGKILSNDTTPR